MPKIRSLTILTLLAALISGAFAQGYPPLSSEAAERIRLGEAAAQSALDTYSRHYPDLPLWQEAFEYAEQAISLAPGNPEPLRFKAIAYTLANWYGPAWTVWQDFLGRGFPLDASATPVFVEAGQRLAYSQYEQGNLELSLRTYLAVLDEVPFDLESVSWAGRILMELERPAQAISYWTTITERDPADARAVYFRDLARDQVEWGVEATNEFRLGVSFYESGSLTQARDHFTRATLLNSSYPEAFAWLGRVAFELGNFQDARTHYTRASQLEPANETYRYFMEESARRLGD